MGIPSREWTFDVNISSHDGLKNGVLVEKMHRVTVWSDNYTEASLIAIQMAFCFGYPTECNYIE